MVRSSLVLFLVTAALFARGSDFIPSPKEGVSNSVTQPHVTAELISETTNVQVGKPFLVALHLHMDQDWHTYWINPGDAGLATMITWTLPPGFTAGPIQWPTPEIHKMGPETTYGYGGDVYLLTTITPISELGGYLPHHLEIKAKVTWLVCQEECIPGKAELTLPLNFNIGEGGAESLDRQKFFAEARSRLPVPNAQWDISAAYVPKLIMRTGSDGLYLTFKNRAGNWTGQVGHPRFFPEQSNVLSCLEADNLSPSEDTPVGPGNSFWVSVALQQNGEKPDHLSGVLVSDRPLQADGAKAIYFSSFPVTPGVAPAAAVVPSAPVANSTTPATAPQAPPFLLTILGAAFLGGIILNLMPCVLPVLSLKVFSLIRHAGENPGGAWKQGAAFTVGVVLSFWALAGVLLALRAAGGHFGWGFQMQSPGFVLTLIFIFFLLALNLFGVFELGTSLVGLDAKAAGHTDGLLGSFLNGALATLAATPCTAPFMGSALGFAAEQPPAVSLLVFTALALGMAAPYLLLTIFPGALRFVPKPGAWMEAVKQFMGFLLLATVIFLVYVFGALVGEAVIPELLFDLLLVGILGWIYGRWGILRMIFVLIFSFIFLGLAYEALSFMGGDAYLPGFMGSSTKDEEVWQPWTPAAVDAALAQGRPVFVDFTAAWCLSCKVNERVALETDEVRAAFAQKNVALFRADWTHADPDITATLQQYHRDGVPLYLYYTPAARDAPEILPAVLTPGIVLGALNKG
jgi:thiol:disulfide interchange protein/DsbC/DsbD-like thiol-disulfide interchange protein